MMKKIFTLMSISIFFIIVSPGLAVAASTAYTSGFNHGVSDAALMNTGDVNRYILQAGKGFEFHTHEFNSGYVDGFCSISGKGYSSDSDRAGFDCARGPDSAFWISDK